MPNCETSLSNSLKQTLKYLSRKCIDEKDLWVIVRWCGEGERKTPPYPLVRTLLIVLGLMSAVESIEKELLQSFRCFNWILAAIKHRMNKSYVILNSVVNRKRESLC
jgi:hypothetical protein